jgi:hypothetical protein
VIVVVIIGAVVVGAVRDHNARIREEEAVAAEAQRTVTLDEFIGRDLHLSSGLMDPTKIVAGEAVVGVLSCVANLSEVPQALMQWTQAVQPGEPEWEAQRNQPGPNALLQRNVLMVYLFTTFDGARTYVDDISRCSTCPNVVPGGAAKDDGPMHLSDYTCATERGYQTLNAMAYRNVVAVGYPSYYGTLWDEFVEVVRQMVDNAMAAPEPTP